MIVFVSFKSRFDEENRSAEYNAVKVCSDRYFLNITTDDGEFYSYPHSHIVLMKIEERVKES